MADIVVVPWWAKRIRHGSLFRKRLGCFIAVASVGISWFLGDVYGLWLQYCGRFEDRAYTNWWIKMGEWLGFYDLPREPLITPVFEWLSFLGDVGFYVGITWALVWIYCDSWCTATEQCMSSPTPSTFLQRRIFYKTFLAMVGIASLIGLISYDASWRLFRRSGLETWAQSQMARLSEERHEKISIVTRIYKAGQAVGKTVRNADGRISSSIFGE